MPEHLNDDDRAACEVCAGWLSTGVQWTAVSSLAALVGFISAAAAHHNGCLALLALLWGLERIAAVRVHLDALLFRQLARDELPLNRLDTALQRLFPRESPAPGRPLDDRLKGAMRWYRRRLFLALATWIPAAWLYFT